MNRRKRRLRCLILSALLCLTVLLFYLFRYRVGPIIRELATTSVSNESSVAINRAILRQIDENEIAYDRIILLEKNAQGDISAIKTNMAEVNRLKTAVLSMVDEEVMELSVNEIGVPIGSVILPELFSGKGPSLPVRVLSVSTSDASFESLFSQAGINQTRHQIMLTVTATMTVLTPLGTQNVSVESQMIVAETVIVGAVPNTFMQVAQRP